MQTIFQNRQARKGGLRLSAMLRLLVKIKRSRFGRFLTTKNLAIAITAAATLSGIATYFTITRSSSPFGPDPDKVIALVLTNLALLLALGVIISHKLIRLWLERRRGSVGSRLQTRIVVMFSLVSILPTIIVAVFSALFFNFGIQAWFNERVDTALNESVAVAESYLAEHKENIKADILAMANDLSREAPGLMRNPGRFKTILSSQAVRRNLIEAYVFQGDKILTESNMSFSLMFDYEEITDEMMERAGDGEVVIITSDADDRVRALIKLNNFFDSYLIVGRPIDSRILNHVELTKGSANEYQRLKADISNIQIKFSVVFVGVALLLLLAAIWFGMVFTGELVEPISRLVAATDRVKAGDLKTRVEDGPKDDEIGTLNRAFNRMTGQLEKQREELTEVSRQIDNRRRVIEAVLSGVSAGVIALDNKKRVNLINPSALTLLAVSEKEILHKKLDQAFPELHALFEEVEIHPKEIVQSEVSITRNHSKFSFLVRIAADELGHEIEGYIVTFDDITELQAAQRSAAWSGVARRIAHEIKNPLTPIHLAAERLKRKYRKEIKNDPDTFDRYLDTITRHVGDIGKMVEEFVNFARMPSPVFNDEDLTKLIKDAVFSQKNVNPDIEFNLDMPDAPVFIDCDRRQIEQALINLIKNTMEALETKTEQKDFTGKINIRMQEDNDSCNIEIKDNGPGFPHDMLDRLTEPYVTTRERGTGLGLAIVKKVVDDHEGKLILSNISDKEQKITGARAVVSFPKSRAEAGKKSSAKKS